MITITLMCSSSLNSSVDRSSQYSPLSDISMERRKEEDLRSNEYHRDFFRAFIKIRMLLEAMEGEEEEDSFFKNLLRDSLVAKLGVFQKILCCHDMRMRCFVFMTLHESVFPIGSFLTNLMERCNLGSFSGSF